MPYHGGRFQHGPGFGPAYVAKGGALGMCSVCLIGFALVLMVPGIFLTSFGNSNFGAIEKGGPFDDPFFTKDGYDKFEGSKRPMRIIGPIILIIAVCMIVSAVVMCIYLSKMSRNAMSSNNESSQPMTSTTVYNSAGPTSVVHPPPANQPPPQTQYPQGSYPPPQGQYPPPQGQYPPPQGQYPPPQGQYPPSQQYGQQYGQQYPARQGYNQEGYPQGLSPPPQNPPYQSSYPQPNAPPNYEDPPSYGQVSGGRLEKGEFYN